MNLNVKEKIKVNNIFNLGFSFYWIFPSKGSCFDKCGNFNMQLDCSCRHTCMRRGNCCDDFEKECYKEILKENCKLCGNCIESECVACKENAFFDQNKSCQCKEGFNYNLEEDICSLNKKEETINYKNNNITFQNNSDKYPNSSLHIDTNKFLAKRISNNITESFNSTDDKIKDDKEISFSLLRSLSNIFSNNNTNDKETKLYLNGNITFNILINEKPNVNNHYTFNNHSFNTNTTQIQYNHSNNNISNLIEQ